jgi:hypothetical protein
MQIRALSLTIVFSVVHFACSSSQTVSKQESESLQIQAGNHFYLLNTFEGYYIQDRDIRDSVKIETHFTPEEQLRVLYVVDSVDFWSLKDSDFVPKYITIKPKSFAVRQASYADPFTIHLRTSSKENTIVRRGGWAEDPPPDNAIEIKNAKERFDAVYMTIFSILRKKTEYEFLPYPAFRM